MNTLSQITERLEALALSPEINRRFFKTGPGQYAEHEQFMGVKSPDLRAIAKTFQTLPFSELQILITSPINEKRLLALFILIHQYQKGFKEESYQFYMKNLAYVNNWNLVDASAHWIVGAHLMHADKSLLLQLAQSPILWERRIAIVATWYFIRQDSFEWTIKLAEQLLHDKEDLMHKAVGWILREVGKRDKTVLISFLEKHAHIMPRTMLRYAMERLLACFRPPPTTPAAVK